MKLCFGYDMLFLNIFVFVSHGYFYEGIGSIPVGGSVRHDNCIFTDCLIPQQNTNQTRRPCDQLSGRDMYAKCKQVIVT